MIFFRAMPGQWILFWSVSCFTQSYASEIKVEGLVDRLAKIRHEETTLEKGLIASNRTQSNLKSQVKKIQKLIQLQKIEKYLGKKRLLELEKTVTDLENRRTILDEKIKGHQRSIRKYLMAIESSKKGGTPRNDSPFQVFDVEKLEAPRRRALAHLADQGLRQIEEFRADLADSIQLGSRIQEEKEQLAYLFQDLQEQESLLELNRQMQVDALKKNHLERLHQLEHYQKLKTAESQVEHLMREFNARVELQQVQERERLASNAMSHDEFSKRKGKLPLPVEGGHIISEFGRRYDPRSGLYIFKKGVDIRVRKNEEVRAISAGKVAFSGALPGYGQVVILDHGAHYYSLCAHLGSISKKTNEAVGPGDSIGITADSGDPLYFEIRARNVAVNPLQWVYN